MCRSMQIHAVFELSGKGDEGGWYIACTIPPPFADGRRSHTLLHGWHMIFAQSQFLLCLYKN